MEWKSSLGCLLVWLSFASSADIPTVSSISELKALDYGKCFPQHGLMLLHWLSSIVTIDHNDVVQFKPKVFDPVSSYPFTPYANDNHFLPDLTPTTAYYTVGNLLKGSAGRFPPYVTQDFYNAYNYPTRNRDRIVIRVDSWYNPGRIDRVYVALESSDQRYLTYSPYSPALISARLLRQIASLRNPFGMRNSSVAELYPTFNQSIAIADSMFSEPGLASFLTMAGYDVNGRHGVSVQMWSCSNSPALCKTRSVSMALKTAKDGNARVSWSGLPNSIQKMHTNVALYKNVESNNPIFEVKVNGRLTGTADTTIKLDPGLQLRLLREEVGNTVIWKGPELDDAKGKIPVRIGAMDVSLQLFTSAGYASARLYIRKSVENWKDSLYNSWVAFYARPSDSNNDYLGGQWQWAIYFEKKPSDEFENCDIYEYVSGTAISPDVQIRFFENNDGDDGFRTESWGS
ncbi:uncharacterized protein LOC125294726 [Alosa alosa]|uniref:uncharacterized protein LOC125294726 n=1 Tax=Alosa alosa TaxID=278164 RepID=UPI002015473A|nr:uncharacterized protein LOC125294726 [Alosa alosa]